MKTRINRAVFVVAGSLLVTSSALAHISLDQGGTHLSRYGDGELKDAPCGRKGGTRGTHVYTYTPGQTITVKFVEFVPHPSYFRFAFDQDGDDDFRDPVSIKPIDPARACPLNAADHCGQADFFNTPAVLPGMDNLEPHLAAASKGTYSFQVTLPNVECTNCTLQLIQVMQDTVHGAYNTDPSDPNDLPFYIADNYHQCIDLVLARPSGSGGGGSGGPAPGCTCTMGTQGLPSTSSAGVFVLFGLWLTYRARRRAPA